MQAAFSVRVFVNVSERKTCAQLPADLFSQRVRKLPAAVCVFKLFAVRFVKERIKRKRVDNPLLCLVNDIIYADVQSAQQSAAFF